jgi:hypothetical protein
VERLRTAHAGDYLIEPATHDPEHSPPERIWRILTAAHHLTRTPSGVEDFDVLAHDEPHQLVARFLVRPAHPNPVRIDPSTRDRWGPHNLNAGWGGLARHLPAADHQQRRARRRDHRRTRVRPRPLVPTSQLRRQRRRIH